jgi:hypothetical protein
VPEFMRMKLRSSYASGTTGNMVERQRQQQQQQQQQQRASSSYEVEGGETITSSGGGGVDDGDETNDKRASESRIRPTPRRDTQRGADGRRDDGAMVRGGRGGGGVGSSMSMDNDLIAKLRQRRRMADVDDIEDVHVRDRNQFARRQQEEEKEEQEEQVVINQQRQQSSQLDDPSSPYTTSTVYDTAVLAAKNAIDTSNLSRNRSHCRDVQSLPENSEGKYPYEDSSILSHDPSLLMDPTPEPSVSASFLVEDEKEEKGAMKNHVGRRQLLPPAQHRTKSPEMGGEENFFDQSFADATSNTFHQLSRQLPSTSTTHDIAAQPPMENDENDGFDNNVFTSFDPLFHEDESSSDGDGDSGHVAADDDEEEFTVDAPNFADSDLPGPRAVIASLHVPPAKDQGEVHQRGVASFDRKNVSVVSSFRVRPLEISPGAVAAEPCQNPLSGNVILCHRRLGVDGFCGEGDVFIEEFDCNNLDVPLSSSPLSPVPVLSTCISIGEIKAKLSRTSSTGVGVQVLGVSSVLSLAAGIHRVQGRARVRVAALVEVHIASLNSYLGASSRKIPIVAVWRWGYNPSGTTLASLQSVLTMDSIDDEDSRRYDPKTLQVADGLLFLGGNLVSRNTDSNVVTTTASIFFAKPAVRHSWTAVPLRNAYSLNAVTLAVANDSRPHLAVGLSDGSVQILTYDLAARTNRLSGHLQTSTLLQTLCYMRGESDVRDLGDNDYLWPEDERFFSLTYRDGTELPLPSQYISTKLDLVRKGGIIGGCTSLAWRHHDSSGKSSLPLLAAAFSSGIAVYHVVTHAAQQQQQVLAVPRILPLAQSKFISSIEESEIETASEATKVTFRKPYAKIGWFDLGPRSPPGLALLFDHEKLSYQHGTVELVDKRCFTRLCLCAVDIPIEIDGKIDMHRPIGVIAQQELNVGDGDGVSIVNQSARGGVVCYSAGSILSCEPMVIDSGTTNISDSNRAIDGYFSSLLRPVSSAALGLDSDGSVYLGCLKSSVTPDYQDVMLTVFSVTSCVRDLTPTIPSQRHWLLISTPGDGDIDKLTQHPLNHPLGGDTVHGGASTDILFELTCGENPVAGLVPQRIAKEEGGRRVAVMFSSGFFGGNFQYAGENRESNRVRRTHTWITPNTIAYSILDIEDGLIDRGSTSFKLLHGRDATFLPPLETEEGIYCSSLVVLDVDGSTLSLATVISSSTLSGGKNDKVVESIQKCSLQYEGIEGRRVFALVTGKQPRILLSGYSALDKRPCLLLSKHSLERGSLSQLSLVENCELGHRIWLRPGEEVLSLLELPRHGGSTNSNVAVASQERVMILSSESDSLVIIAEIDVHLTCASLSPMGSHCVAFCASSGVSNGVERSRVMYLSCLKGIGGYGIVATLPTSRHGKGPTLLAAIRPDRLVYFASHSVLQMVDEFEDENAFVTPLACTRPLLLLEPLIANSLCQDLACGTNAAINNEVQRSLRTTIEKFGRKDMACPYCDDEGIGTHGSGITSQVYNMLAYHKCFQAASILLSGNALCDIISQPKILPPWVPIQSKLSAATGAAMTMQVLSYGDSELAELLRHSDHREVDGTFPGPLNLSSTLSQELAMCALNGGSNSDAIKLLGLAGSQSSENLLAQIIFSPGAIPTTNNLIEDFEKLLNDADCAEERIPDEIKNCSKLCLDIGLRLRRQKSSKSSSNDDASAPPVLQLAPSVQSVWETERVRNSIVSNNFIGWQSPSKSCSQPHDVAWKESLIKSKHIWTSGPLGKQNLLLQLSGFGDWLGRCCPTALGKNGVAIAAERGEQTLAEILYAAARAGEAEGAGTPQKNNFSTLQKDWVKGVGEGRQDEDNLSLYIRFSEGADEDGNWKSDGFTDLTKHAHIARLFGYEFASVEATTSSVDEGEEGKVRLLYDLVYHEGAPREQPTGLIVDAPRGGPLDVGIFHNAQHMSRQRCSIELWYHLPQARVMTDEIILVRRSLFYEENSDAHTLCMPDEKHNILWELAVLPTGLLELRTGAGSVVTSVMNAEDADGFVSWEREDGVGGWNHVCIIFTPLSHSFSTELSAIILMNGSIVVQGARISVNPFGSEYEQELCEEDIEEAMEKTLLIFGIGPSAGFRMTDLRVWSCQRSEDDINMMMYEYLNDAQMKKKLKVNIRKDAKVHPTPLRLHRPESKKGFALAPPPRQSPSKRESTRKDTGANSVDSPDSFVPSFANFPNALDVEILNNSSEEINREEYTPLTSPPFSVDVEEAVEKNGRLASSGLEMTLSDLLSTKIKKSAAAAIIRGPPAARHFGGNRGGLLSEHVNFGSKCDGVGPIVICGADKSVVWFNDRDPPGRTIPIGASGAVLSDIVDENLSEYMCCFLAKDKRMVVFELSRKTVVIELQMKTKLNFWRYLPPEAHGSSLVFVLITPIGGFHWKPLDLSPRPFQVWKRGPELELKKILSYEEGGSNGLIGINARSTVALVIASSASLSSASVEAYCIPMFSGHGPLCISNVILGAALYRPAACASSPSHFLPFVITISKDITSQIVLDIEDLLETSGTLVRGSIIASTVLDLDGVDEDESYEPPSMSMGYTPEVLCCCHDGFIFVIIRRQGFVLAYDFSSDDELILVGKTRLGQYVVDAAVRSSDIADDSVELVVLLSESEDSKDGRVACVGISRLDGVSSHSRSV